MQCGQRTAPFRSLSLALLIILAGQLSGCPPFGTVFSVRLLRGSLLGRDSLAPPTDVMRIVAETSTEGERTGGGDGGNRVLPSPEDGSFELRMPSRDTSSSPSDVPSFPPPDEIVVTVVRQACTQQFTIGINEDTVVDVDFPDDVIELKDPILVPPCEEGDAGN